MKLFLVFREGVYRHSLVSVSRSEADAHHNAKAALEGEHDGYHSFGVYRVDTNKALTYIRQDQHTPYNDDRAKLVGTYKQVRFASKPACVVYREAK